MYKNLELIIFQNKISKYEMAQQIGVTYNMLLDKLSCKKPLKLDEAFKIRVLYAPDKSIEWLFEADTEEKSA